MTVAFPRSLLSSWFGILMPAAIHVGFGTDV